MRESLKVSEELIDSIINEKDKIFKIRLKDNGKIDIFISDGEIICYKFYKDFILPLRYLM